VSGGSGGGGSGAGGSTAATNGTANLGGGGGGGGNPSSVGGNGGSGIVIISYAGAQQFGGGIVTSVGGNTIHTFNTSGTLSPLSSLTASYLIVAGGGGGGSGNAGGGGAGGLASGSALTIDTSSTYLVTVGAGGAASAGSGNGVNGGNSSFSMVSTTLVGGGGGATFNSTGSNGGSGGGGCGQSASVTGGTGTSGQGNTGGSGNLVGTTGGGGGGSGSAGSNGDASNNGGNGGTGTSSSISGASSSYAGGGGGGARNSGTAGTGQAGGGNGGTGGSGTWTGGNATAGTGSGGGGGGGQAGVGNGNGGNGGSGIVIISYAGSTQQMAGGSVTITGGNVIHTFTSSGYLTPLTYYSNSLRYRSSASASLTRTPTVASNRQTWTWSAWVKRGTLSSRQSLFCGGSNATSTDHTYIEFSASDVITVESYASASSLFNLQTSAVYRDPAAWYHIVYVLDTTQATSSNRVKLYVNGTQVTAFGSATYPSQNYSGGVNTVSPQRIGAYSADFGPFYFDGYMSNINFIDGQALTPNSFGTFNSYGVWQPINYGGSYGTNGFYLPFNANAQTYADYINGGSTGTQQSVTASGITAQGTNSFTTEFFYYCLGDTGSDQQIFDFGVNGYSILLAQGTKNIQVFNRITAGTIVAATGSQLTYNQWHHIAFVRNGSACSLYIDGVLAATGTDSTNFTSTTVSIGCRYAVNAGNWYPANGYMSNARVVNGTAVYTSNFIPSTTPLTAITNTLLLTLQNSTFVDNSTNAYTLTNNGGLSMKPAKALAISVFNDQSPQGNNWTPNNISGATGSTLDYMTDVPTLTSATAANYAVLNPLDYNVNNPPTLADGNLRYTTNSAIGARSTIAMSSGKWYCEVRPTSTGNMLGIIATSASLTGVSYPGSTANGYGYYSDNGNKYNNGSNSAYGATYGNGDVIGIAFDADAGTLTYYKNNTSQGTAFTGLTSGPYSFVFGNGTSTGSFNFGQQPFVYTPPSTYVALNTYNL
jgi:hypothetical protein